MRGKLRNFPEIVKADINLRTQKAYMEAKPSFDQYVALEHAIEDAGGAIHMFHPDYLVPQAHYAMLGTKDRSPDSMDALQKQLGAIRGVRSAIVDPNRWFTNETGLDVGGAVIFSDYNPRLDLDLVQAGKRAGYIVEPRDHEHMADDKEWSETNHHFAGLCLLFLAAIGILQIGLSRPNWFVKYGTVIVWTAMFFFLFIRADRTSWPLGRIGWLDSFHELDTAQHRLGEGLLLLVCVGDYFRVRSGWRMNPQLGRWGLLAIGVAGSTMLFTHLHTTLDPAHYWMVVRMNIEHGLMATAAVGFTVSKFVWDTWQRPKKWGPYLWLIFLAILGLILNMYVE